MKALSTTMTIIVTIIVILIAALVILTVFSGGINQAAEQINKWFGWINGQPLPNINTGGSTGLTGATCTQASDCQSGFCSQSGHCNENRQTGGTCIGPTGAYQCASEICTNGKCQ